MNRSRQLLRATGLVTALTLAGCKSNSNPAQTANGQDPADANLAQPYTGGDAGGYTSAGQPAPQPSGQTHVLGQSQSYNPQASGESYETQAPAPIIRQAPSTEYYPVPQAQGSQGASYSNDGQGYNDAEEAGEQALAETDQAPPPLPEYDQPPAPEDDYLWTPGYWNYASAGYYWVPGVWCAPPFYGALWTPPYWGYYNNHYLFHRGYWGPHVGYYGGINYGFGYIGVGYFGGYWHGRDFYYNRAVTNVNITNIHNVYNRTVIYNNRTYGPHPLDRVSYNGGPGGLHAQPTPQELGAMHEAHYAPVAAQRENRMAAAGNRAQFFRADGGRPAQAFASHPLGAPANIAAAPREQPFNRAVDRPNNIPRQPGFSARPNTPPAVANHEPFSRPGLAAQPGFSNNRPGTHIGTPAAQSAPNAHIGTPYRPGFNNHPGTHIGTPEQPNFNNNHPGTHIGTPEQPNFNNNNRPTTHIGTPAQPAGRPNGFDRSVQQPPASRPNTPPPTQPRPSFETARPAEPQPRPNLGTTRPAEAQPRPNTEPSRPAPEPQPRQQPSAPRPSAPSPRPSAPEPHPGDGGNHGRPQ